VRRFLVYFLSVLLLFNFVSAYNNETGSDDVEGQPYTNIGLTKEIANITATLRVIAPHLSVGLLILGGIVYGLSYLQTAEVRGKWQTVAIGLVVGGIIIAAITVAADEIQKNAGKLLTS
jgi:hypothetical protein